MKTRKLLFWLLVPFMALVINSCENSSGSSGGSAAVTPNNLTFSYDASSQIVTINKGEYSHYGASIGDGAHGWCNVNVLDNNQVEIRVSINSNTTPRQGTINCWVANTQYPSDDEKVILPVAVTQNVCDLQVTEATWMKSNFEMEADMDVLEGHYNSFARTKDNYFQEEDYVWVGRDRDEGEVEVHFNLR